MHARNVDLKKPEHRTGVTQFVEKRILASENELKKVIPRFDENDLYYMSKAVPMGMSDDALKEFVSKYGDRLQADKRNFVYYQDNRIADVIDGKFGEFTTAKRIIQAKNDDNPRNDKIEYGFTKYMSKIENKQQIYRTATLPAIKDTLLYGLGPNYINFNAYKNLPYGKIEIKYENPRNVLVDVNSTTDFFDDRKYECRMIEMELEDARRYLKQFGVNPNNVSPDTEHRMNNSQKKGDTFDDREFVTIYLFEYVETHYDEFSISNYYDIPLGEMKPEEDTLEQEEDYYFTCLFTKNNGVFHHAENYEKEWLMKFYWNKKNYIGLYPTGEPDPLKKIQDLISIGKSLILDNARQRNTLRVVLKKALRDKYGKAVDDWLLYGGELEIGDDVDGDIKSLVQFMEIPGLPKEVYEFVKLAEDSLTYTSGRYDALRGDYPEKKLSGVAINEIGKAARKPLTYLDENINKTNNDIGRHTAKLMAKNFTEEDFCDITDAKKGEPTYIPINAIYTIARFEQYLIESNIVTEDEKMMIKQIAPNDPEFIQKRSQILSRAAKLFEKKNEVIYVTKNYDLHEKLGYGIDEPIPMKISAVDESGQMVDVSINPKKAYFSESLIFINHIADAEMEISISMDFDAERDKQTDHQVAAVMFEKYGTAVLEEFLETVGGVWANNKEEILKKITAAEKGQQFAQVIEQRGPEFEQAFAAFIQQYDAAMSAKKMNPSQTTQTATSM